MHLTPEYIAQKRLEWESKGYDKYKVRALVDNLQIRMELAQIDRDLSSDGTGPLTTPTSAST